MASSILLIPTGGTIAMVRDTRTGALAPADLSAFQEMIPELLASDIHIHIHSMGNMIDSSDIRPDDWVRIATTIYEQYDRYDGFVVLHGTDTMSYTASALSFMLEGLQKPVVLTGSQLPIGVLRSDARENLLTALEIASARDEEGNMLVPEVTIFFEDRLFRGNRTTKRNAEHFSAFNSYNYPALAKAGVHITYQPHLIHYCAHDAQLRLHTHVDTNVVVLKLFPGISQTVVHTILTIPGVRGVVLETFGAGNAPSAEWLYRELKEAVDRGLIIVNKTQCNTGSVEMGLYATSVNLVRAGVLSGYDITTEALLTKMMTLLGEFADEPERVKQLLQTNMCGEVTL